MIGKLEIEGVHLSVDDKIRSYVKKKIGNLDKYLPEHAKESAHAEVFLISGENQAKSTICEVNLYLPKEVINVKESAVNVFAAIDMAEDKLIIRLKKYKDKNSSKERRHLIGRFLKKAD